MRTSGGPALGLARGELPGKWHDDDAAGPLHSAVLPDEAEKLRDIQSITDAALSALGPQALLDVLVDRVKQALQAEYRRGAAAGPPVRPAGGDGGERAGRRGAAGCPDTAREGFAGRIAAQGRPVILDEVDRTKVVNPILLARGSGR